MIPVRPVLALVLACCLIGGTSAYLRFANSVRRPPVEYDAEFSGDRFELDIQRTFDCEGDALAELNSLEVSFRGKQVFVSQDSIVKTEPIRVSIPDGVEIGENEIFVTASRAIGETELAAMRVVLIRNDVEIREAMISSEPDFETVSGTIQFRIEQEDDHE